MARLISKFPRPVRAFAEALRDLLRTSALYRRTATASGLLLLLMILLPLWRILPIAGDSPYIPLHYNIYVGVDAFGPWYGIFALPFLGSVLYIVNLIFQAVFYRREHVLSMFFAIATLVTESVLLVAMVLIVLLNL
jgi:hypothetical protein